MRRLLILAAICSLTSVIGCGKGSSSNKGNVAVVDLDQIAAQLGFSQQWSAAISQRQSRVNQQLTGLQQQLNQQLQTKRAELTTAAGNTESLPESLQTQLVSYQQDLNSQLRQAQNQATQHLTAQRNQLLQRFRTQVAQTAASVAQEQGFDVVLTHNQTVVLSLAPSADITTAVIARLQQTAARPAKPLPLPSTSGASR